MDSKCHMDMVNKKIISLIKISLTIMKLRSLFFAAICGLAVSTSLTSCSSDDDDNSWSEGSKVTMPQYRGFILNEGSSKKNNASLMAFDVAADTATLGQVDFFEVQNGKKVGDTGQSLLAYEGNLYMAVYGSSYISKMNGAGVEQKTFTCDDKVGQPRYMAAAGGYLYVTTYGGYVAKINANTLQLEDTVRVGKAPEAIVESNGVLYCANGSSMDGTKDHRVAIINESNFHQVKYVEVASNTQKVVAMGDYVFVQSFGTDWVETPLQQYNVKTGELKDLGFATHMVVSNNKLYYVYSKTDWSVNPRVTVNTYNCYDPATGNTENITSKVTSGAADLASATIYGLSVNPYDGSFYVATTLYSKGNGTLYHFGSDWTFKSKFTTWGQNPNSVVFIK